MSVAFLFPGQGSQFPGMLHELSDNGAMAEAFTRAKEALNEDPFSWDSEQALRSTKNVQLALLTVGVGAARSFASANVRPDYVAGHSVGAFSAAVAADVLSFEDALHLVRFRGEQMEETFPEGYGMGVVQGPSFHVIEAITKEAREQGETVYASNENSACQTAVSGAETSIARVFATARKHGAKRTRMLDVRVPSHCSLFTETAKALSEKINEVNINRPRMPYVANRTARLLYDPEKIREDLAFNLAAPVRWHQGMMMLYERGTRTFIQFPPGRVYADLISTGFKDCRAIAVDHDISDVAHFLQEKER